MSGASTAAPETYSAVSKWVHWIVALCILGLIPVGVIMQKVGEGPLQDRLYDLHRSTGILVLALAVLRVAARIAYGVPHPARTLTPLELAASTAAHRTLLILIFVMPIVGWLMMSAYGADVPIFGLFTLPRILPESEATYTALSWTHFALGLLMALVILAHVGGALMHALVKRDGVIQRMLPLSWGRALDQALPRGGAANKST